MLLQLMICIFYLYTYLYTIYIKYIYFIYLIENEKMLEYKSLFKNIIIYIDKTQSIINIYKTLFL